MMPIDSQGDAAREAKVQLIYVLEIVRRHVRLALLLFLCPILGAFIYYWAARPVYQSKAQVLVSRRDAMADKLSDELLATHMRLIQSPLVVSRALERVDESQPASGGPGLKAHQLTIEGVINRLSVSRGGLGQARVAQVLDVAYRGDSAVESQRVLTAIIESYHEFLDQQSPTSSVRDGTIVHGSRVNLLRELAVARSRVKDLLPSSGIGSVPPGPGSGEAKHGKYEQTQQNDTAQNLQMIEADSRLRAVNTAVKDLNEVTDRLVRSMPDAPSTKPTGIFTNVLLASPEPGKYLTPRLTICLTVGSLCGLMLSVVGIFLADNLYATGDRIGVRSPRDHQQESTAGSVHASAVPEIAAGEFVNGATRSPSRDELEPKTASGCFPAPGAP